MRIHEIIAANDAGRDWPEIPAVIEDPAPIELAVVVKDKDVPQRLIVAKIYRVINEIGNIPIIDNSPVEVEVEVPVEVEVEKVVEVPNPVNDDLEAEVKELKKDLASTRRALTVAEKKLKQYEDQNDPIE